MGKMYFPSEKPEVIDEMMDKESWIQSRTDNPDRLGRDVWGWVYDKGTGKGTSDVPKDAPKDFLKKMTEEFIQKNNLSVDLNDSIQLETAKLLMQVTRDGEDFQSIKGFQKCLDQAAALSKKEKSHSTLRDTLKKCQQNNVQAMQAARNKAKAGRG